MREGMQGARDCGDASGQLAQAALVLELNRLCEAWPTSGVLVSLVRLGKKSSAIRKKIWRELVNILHFEPMNTQFESHAWITFFSLQP